MTVRPRAGVLVVSAWVEDGGGLRARITSAPDVDAADVQRRLATSEEDVHTAVGEWLRSLQSGAPQ